MSYKGYIIANTILKIGDDKGIPMTHLKLQKMLFFMCGFYFATHDDKLIDEDFEVWDYGPVIPDVYHKFKKFKHEYITNLYQDNDNNIEIISRKDEKFYSIVEKYYDKYIVLGEWDMVYKTHDIGTPWAEAKKNKETKIQHEDMRKTFKDEIAK